MPLFDRYANGFAILNVSFYRWRDRQTWKDVQGAWQRGDIRKGISIPIPHTKYTCSIR